MSKEWVQELTRLLRGGAALENGLNSVNSREGNEFALEQRDIAKQRDSTLHLIQKRLQGFKTGLKNIDNRLKSVREQKRGAYDPEELQKYLESFEAKLTSYKGSMRAEYDQLKHEEDRLGVEVTAMCEKIEGWERSSSSSSGNDAAAAAAEAKSSQRARIQNRYEKQVELQSKIGAIDRQLASAGGMYCGWDGRDHDAFVRAWVQSTSASQGAHALSGAQRKVLMKRCVAHIPVKTEEELEAHVDWYVAHLELSAQKKVLLDEWKDSRRAEQTRKYKSTLEAELDEQELGERGLGGGVPASVFQRVEDREAQKLRIASWKTDREEQEQRRLQAGREAKLEEEQSAEDAKRKRQAVQRAKLESWKKEEEKCKDIISKTKKVTAGVAPRVTSAQLAERQKRDRELTQLQLARKEKMQDRALARETKVRELAKGLVLEGAGMIAPKQDTDRLRTGTKAFNQHKFETESFADAQKRRSSTSAHSSHMHMHGRDLQNTGRMPAAWLSRK